MDGSLADIRNSKIKDRDAARIHPTHTPVTYRETSELGLTDPDAYVLNILDTCYVGNMWKVILKDAESFEVLAVPARHDMTAAPGPKSFIRALIDGLRDRLTRPEPCTAVEPDAKISRRCKDERTPLSFRCDQDKHKFIKLLPLDSV
ncbi:hypothetical protein DOTSEDRAFT_30718 [Dothistroma septosporum NZE10]|uniref:Uncharacterized protein n=1 Tax=Dothistroma septosporum (strain NZE10 / CBS 128990) TaxID=675120 RepID=N1Q445_DOTSN|nr:hypothetical protein DOTSEDRAFT_30718 [Dothistroma septosporum NZE10]